MGQIKAWKSGMGIYLACHRWAYAFQNPLMYVDPSGEFFLEGITIGLIAKAVGFLIGANVLLNEFVFPDRGQKETAIYNPAPTPSSGQNGSQSTASELGPANGEIYRLNLPMGIEQNSYIQSLNATSIASSVSQDSCPSCYESYFKSRADDIAAEYGIRNYGGDGSGSFHDRTMRVLDEINQYNPIANLWDVVSHAFTGKDRLGNEMNLSEASLKAISVAPVPVLKIGSKTLSVGSRGLNGVANTGKNVVYQGIDASDKVRYIGITRRAPEIRFNEHLNSIGTGKELLRYRVIDGATNLTRTQARVWEQTLINRYGLQKHGGTLMNRINSISPRYWWQYGIE